MRDPVGTYVILVVLLGLILLPARLPWAIVAAWRGSWLARGEVALSVAISTTIWMELGPFVAIVVPLVVIVPVMLVRFARRVNAEQARIAPAR